MAKAPLENGNPLKEQKRGDRTGRPDLIEHDLLLELE